MIASLGAEAGRYVPSVSQAAGGLMAGANMAHSGIRQLGNMQDQFLTSAVGGAIQGVADIQDAARGLSLFRDIRLLNAAHGVDAVRYPKGTIRHTHKVTVVTCPLPRIRLYALKPNPHLIVIRRF